MSTNSTIWMGEIDPSSTEQEIMSYFRPYNLIPINIKFIRDRETNLKKNFCFLDFKTVKEANLVLFKLNGKIIHGTNKTFRLNWANSRSISNKSVYVGNLNPKVDDLKLFHLFRQRYPSVHHASVITEDGKSKEYGFVIFHNGDSDYERCLKEMNGIEFYGNKIKVRPQRAKNEEQNKHMNDVNNENNFSMSNGYSENFFNDGYDEGFFNPQSFDKGKIFINNNNDNIVNNLYSNHIILGTNNSQFFSYDANTDNIISNNVNNKFYISDNNIHYQNNFLNPNRSNSGKNQILNQKKIKKKKKYEIKELKYINEDILYKNIHDGIQKIYNFYKSNPNNDNKTINCKFFFLYSYSF